MKCEAFPQCSLDCENCPEFIKEDKPLNEGLEYMEEVDADAWLSSIEAHELRFLF